MASNRAPGVKVSEIDLSEVMVPAGTSVGATVGRTPIGPTNRRISVLNNRDFVSVFGSPTSGDAPEYPMYTSLEYLTASDGLWFVRPAGCSDKVGGLAFSSGDVTSGETLSSGYEEGATYTGEFWTAGNETKTYGVKQVQEAEAPEDGIFSVEGYEDGNKKNKYYPGEQMNGNMLSICALGASGVSDRIGVIVVTEANTETSSSDYTYGYTWAGKYPEKNAAKQPVHYYRINVYVKGEDQTAEDAGWTAIDPLKTLTPVESWVVTNDPTAKDASGNSMYVKDVVNGYSNYIYVNTNNSGFNYEDATAAPIFYPSTQFSILKAETNKPKLIKVDGDSSAPSEIPMSYSGNTSSVSSSGNEIVANLIGTLDAGLEAVLSSGEVSIINDDQGWSGTYIVSGDWTLGPVEGSQITTTQVLVKSESAIETVTSATVAFTSTVFKISNTPEYKSNTSPEAVAAWVNLNGKSVFGLPKGVYGMTGNVDEEGDCIAACWESLFSSKEQVTPNILLAPYALDRGIEEGKLKTVCNIASTRRDCMAIIPAAGLYDTKAQDIVAGMENRSWARNSYVAIYAGADLIYDTWTNKNVWLPKVCFAGRIIANNDEVANVWDAPAGINRGAMNTLDQMKVYTEAEIGYMYNANINTSKRVRGSGDFMWGQKTGQLKASALDRINVRRLLLYIENTLEPQLQAYLFEPNTELLRSRVKSGIDQFLETIYAGGGLYAWNTVCDTSNNTPYTIDNNELNIDIYVQPTKTVEYINLNIIVTRTGVSFAEA